jgi:hypothetical protein
MTHPWITTNNGEAEQQAARDSFLKLLLDYRSKKQVEPETILLRAGTMKGGVPDSSVLEPSTNGYMEVPDMNQARHAKTFVESSKPQKKLK